MSLLVTCPQLTAEHIPLLDAAALPQLLPWLMLCNSARVNTNANTNRLKHCLATYSYLIQYHREQLMFVQQGPPYQLLIDMDLTQ